VLAAVSMNRCICEDAICAGAGLHIGSWFMPCPRRCPLRFDS